MSRKWPFLLLLLIILGGGAAFAWQVALNRMEQGLAAWAEARRAEGWRITHAAPARGPLPWRPEIALAGLEAASPLGPALRAGAARIQLDPWRPSQLQILLEGPLAVAAGGAWAPVEARRVEGHAALDGRDLLWHADDLAAPGIALRRLALRWREGHAQVTGEGARLGPLALDSLSLLARVERPAATPEAFRAQGGSVQVIRAEARRGEAVAEATATLALDAALQPEGRGQLTLHAPGEWVRLVREAGLVAPQAAAPLALAAQLGARVPPGGGPPRLEMPAELRGRRLTLARFPVATLPEVAWR